MGASPTFEQQPQLSGYEPKSQPQQHTADTLDAVSMEPSADTLLPPLGSLQMSVGTNSSTTSSSSSGSSYSFTPSKKLLYTLDPPNLALIVKYIIENEALFEKYRHQSDDIYHAFINFGIRGKMIRKLTSLDFAEELPWIRRVITTRLHVWLKTSSDDEILTILNQTDDPYTPHAPNGRLPLYLRERCMSNRSDSSSSSGSSGSRSSTILKFSPDVVDQLVTLGYGTEQECIKASAQTVNYNDINDVMEQLTACNDDAKDACELCMYDESVFQVFVYLLCVKHACMMDIDTDRLVRALIDIGMNGREFMSMKRLDFCRAVKAYGIKGGTTAKLYKLILTNCDNVSQYLEANNMAFMINMVEDDGMKDERLNAVQLAEIAVCDFTVNAQKKLDAMDRAMSAHLVNGLVFAQHYESKQALKVYMASTMRHKSVNRLVDLLWNNYERDKEKEIARIERFDKDELMKYFTCLYMHQLQSVIIKEDLNEDKLRMLKRKEVCQLIIDGCGFSIGVTTNIVDTIYQNVNK